MPTLPALLVCVYALLGVADLATADEPSLTLSRAGATHRFTAAQLLARPDAADIGIANDVAYGRAMNYRAVPLLALLSDLPPDPRADTMESRATDGFVAQIPMALLAQATTGGAVPWVAVEPPDHAWPPLPGKSQGAGPFYLIWQHPERARVGSEQWPYQLASLTAVESPAHRWPQLAVGSALPPDAPARRGEAVFVANCLPCHKLNGGGAGEMGPDLAHATSYLTGSGLRAIVRNPRAVRTWPLQQMPGFAPDALSDADLDALVAYLHQAAR
jgi:mono/diheme cytochrome c family protein